MGILSILRTHLQALLEKYRERQESQQRDRTLQRQDEMMEAQQQKMIAELQAGTYSPYLEIHTIRRRSPDEILDQNQEKPNDYEIECRKRDLEQWENNLLKEYGTPEQQARVQQLYVERDERYADRERLEETSRDAGEDIDRLITALRAYVIEFPFSTNAFRLLAINLRKKGYFEESIRTYEEWSRVMQHKYKDNPGVVDRMDMYIKGDIGAILLEKGDVEESIAIFNQVIARAKTNPLFKRYEVHLYLGDALLRQGDTKAAKREWKRALALWCTVALEREVGQRLKKLRDEEAAQRRLKLAQFVGGVIAAIRKALNI